MNITSSKVRNTYLALILFNTLAASLIWGIGTVFMLNAGLNNTEAFAANAFFAFGQMIFEIPTGIVADVWGRRLSYILGAVTLSVVTFLYYLAWLSHGPFWEWATISALAGLGFAFFSGATEAWLVDALKATGYKGKLEAVFAKGQIVSGVAMLTGAIGGGFIAQISNLGVPYIVRTVLLLVTVVIAMVYMKDLGFTPKPTKHPLRDIKGIFDASITYGWRNPSIKWTMLAGGFSYGVSLYVFYAMQPRLLEVFGDQTAYVVVGLAAAIFAGSQIIGGMIVPYVSKIFKRRTSIMWWSAIINVVALVLVSFTNDFVITLALLTLWGMTFAAARPARQAFLNGMIPSQQRATVLSFDSLVSSAGGATTQPVLGKVADMNGYPASFLAGAIIQAISIPFIGLARKSDGKSDIIK